jgi:hypothetical protein
MSEAFALSESAVAVLRFLVKGYLLKVTDRSLEAFRELAVAGIMQPVLGADGSPEADYQFTEYGWTRRQELLSEAEERIERERFEPPDASNLSEAARELLRRRLAGDREVTDANRRLYRELVTARIMYPVSTWVGGPESVFRFTRAGWERREELVKSQTSINCRGRCEPNQGPPDRSALGALRLELVAVTHLSNHEPEQRLFNGGIAGRLDHPVNVVGARE